MPGPDPIIVEPQTQTAPEGSVVLTAVAVVESSLLAYLSGTKGSAVFSAASVGSATARRIASALEGIDVLGDLAQYRLDAAPINSLANDEKAAFQAPVSGSDRVRIVILLGVMQPAAGGSVVVSGAGVAYSLALPTSLGPIRLEFADLPAALAASFTVRNISGVAFPASLNTIAVVPV